MWRAAVFKYTVLMIWLVHGAFTPVSIYSAFDIRLSHPFGIGQVFLGIDWIADIILRAPVLNALRFTMLVALCLAILTRWRQGMMVWLAVFCAFILDAVIKSFGGFANHGQILPLVAVGLVGFLPHSECPTGLDLLQRRPVQIASSEAGVRCTLILQVMTVAAILPYSYIGIQRLVDGGVAMFFDHTLTQYLSAATRSFRIYPEWLNVAMLLPWLKLGFGLTTVFEAAAFAAIFSQPYRSLWLGVMCSFHVMTQLAMNVLFWENVFILLALFGWKRGTASYVRVRVSAYG